MTMPPVPRTNYGWRVTAQAETTEVTDDGRPVRGMRIYYQTGKGTSKSVFVPQAQYSEESVYAAIAEDAAKAMAVDALKSN